jgi:hypothetical protein
LPDASAKKAWWSAVPEQAEATEALVDDAAGVGDAPGVGVEVGWGVGFTAEVGVTSGDGVAVSVAPGASVSVAWMLGVLAPGVGATRLLEQADKTTAITTMAAPRVAPQLLENMLHLP